MERIAIIDFGARYNQLIVRAVRECGVFCELIPPTAPIEAIRGEGLSGVILSGCYDSVYQEGARTCSDELLSLGVPVLGICYGMQLIAHKLGGRVVRAPAGEFGKTFVRFQSSPLFDGIPDSIMWMYHNDWVAELPQGFVNLAETDACAHAAMSCEERGLYGVQFHPEVASGEFSTRLFRNFIHNICGCRGGWSLEAFADGLIMDIRKRVGAGSVVAALSGRVESTVAAVLAHRAVGERLTCVLVDHGLFRENEADEAANLFSSIGLNVIRVDSRERFLSLLAGVTESEQKRRLVAGELLRVFEAEAKRLGAEYLVQGTICPDVIENGCDGAAAIKSSHNTDGLPTAIAFKDIIEPLHLLFGCEVRKLGDLLKLPPELLHRPPLPAAALAGRIMGEVTADKLETLRKTDLILREELQKAGLDRTIRQYFTVFTGVSSVGCPLPSSDRSDARRTPSSVIAIRAVSPTDAMTLEFAELPSHLIRRLSARMIAEVPCVARVVYDITDSLTDTVEWE